MSSAQELFNDRIPNALANHREQARAVDAIYCFRITGEGGGTWSVDLSSDPPTCVPEDSEQAQCVVEVSHEDFESMLSDPQAGMQLYFQGRLKLSGDALLAEKLQEFFALANKDA